MSATNKINARDYRLFDVLNTQKYSIDYFQREYSWELKHIEQLITDLSSAFLNAHNKVDARQDVANYPYYYLGPFVISSKDNKRSIVDGQQRLTSLTLFLIYLNHLQIKLGVNEFLEGMVFANMYGVKTFNIQEEKLPGNPQPDDRQRVFNELWLHNEYEIQDSDSTTAKNIALRYADIASVFPEELQDFHILPYFLDWLRYNVIMVEITAFSDDSAYDIFESMNDRGLNLTATEMLKGYLISRFDDVQERDQINQEWKEAILRLQSYGKDEDQKFFQSWLRSQYAETIRQSKAGSQNEDFEKIGTRFHSWVRENLKKLGVQHQNSSEFRELIKHLFFYQKAYATLLEAQKREVKGLEYVFYHAQWRVAESLSMPLMLAPLTIGDSSEVQHKKMNLVARYLETFAVTRSVNFRNFSASSIRYTMYSLVKELRGKSYEDLKRILTVRVQTAEEQLTGITKHAFSLHGMNKIFVKFLLSRICSFIDSESDRTTDFASYFLKPGPKPYEVEHIWSNTFDEHRDEFDQNSDFERYRNKIGALLLLPRGTNQSYGNKPYEEKLVLYLRENLLIQTLHPTTYVNNPNFTNMVARNKLAFRAHPHFKKADIDERQQLVEQICQLIWKWEG